MKLTNFEMILAKFIYKYLKRIELWEENIFYWILTTNFDEIRSIIDKRNSYNFTFYKFILHIYISKNNYENYLKIPNSSCFFI